MHIYRGYRTTASWSEEEDERTGSPKPLVWIIVLSLAGTVATGIAASLFFFVSERTKRTILSSLISYAVGTLLAVALLRLLPRALEQAPINAIMGTVLAGLILFFVLEKTLIWRYCHEVQYEAHFAKDL